MADGFQPKFVDLVRNITTTTGTANFKLGAAVTGYSSFTAACAVGDSFYYSAIGIDRPGEREVGRGTLLAGGVISRDPVGGVKTSFSNGAKSVALVAASEWYSQAQRFIAGVSPFGQALIATSDAAAARDALGVGTAALEPLSRFSVTLPDRAALAAHSGTSTVYLRENGREGRFVWNPSDQSANVAADTMQGIYVAANGGNGANGAWERKFSGGVDVRWFGAKGDGVANDGPAFTAAIALLNAMAVNLTNTYYKGSLRLRVPTGSYYLGATTLSLSHTLIIEGDGSGFAGGRSTVLRWDDGATGILLNRYNTSAPTGKDAITHSAADGTILRGLTLLGGYKTVTTAESESHAIHARCRFMVEDCQFQDWSGDGIHIEATSGDATIDGNANGWRVQNVRASNCRNALYIVGADTNAGSSYKIDASSCRQSAIFDGSFLGNSHISAQAADCGSVRNAIPAWCSYGGNIYAVILGQEAGASTNPPSGNSANNAWWNYVGVGTANLTFGRPEWVTGMTWRAGGAFLCKSMNMTTNFIGCYSEGGQPPAQFAQSTMWTGGQDGAGIVGMGTFGTGVVIEPWQGKFRVRGPVHFPGGLFAPGVAQYGSATANGVATYFASSSYQLTFMIGGAAIADLFGITGTGMILKGNPSIQLRYSPTNTTIATVSNAGLLVNAGGLGYATGAGGAVVQAGNKTTGVTLDKLSGQITTTADSIAAGAAASFLLTNSNIAADDYVDVWIKSGAADASVYGVGSSGNLVGKRSLFIRNLGTADLAETLVLGFGVNKRVKA